MAVYIQGNLARKESVRVERPKEKEVRKVVVRARTLPMQEKLLYLFTVAVCAVVAGVIIWRYAQIYEMNTQIHQVQQDIRTLQAENSMLKEKMDKLNDPEALRKDAEQAGFVPRSDSNTIRVPERNTGAQAASSTAMKK